MNADSRSWVRIFLCAAFIVSLYGGVALLTAVMFVHGHTIFAVISGLVLTGMTAMALGLAALAWSMTRNERRDAAEVAFQSG